jgi:hypothetical protein
VVVESSTELLAPADRVWAQVKRPATVRHVSKGLLGLRVAGGLPDRFTRGDTLRARLLLFHAVPLWRHELQVVRVDDRDLVAETHEHGGPIRRWDHRIEVEQSLGPRSRYTDRVEIEAGVLTPLVWVGAKLLFAYRRARWRRLARGL